MVYSALSKYESTKKAMSSTLRSASTASITQASYSHPLHREVSHDYRTIVKLCDPGAAEVEPLTDPIADGPRLARLVALAKQAWSQSWRGSVVQWSQANASGRAVKGLQSLQFGVTEIMLDRAYIGPQLGRS